MNIVKLCYVIVLFIVVGVEFCKIKVGLVVIGFVENICIGQCVCVFMGVLIWLGVLLCVVICGVIGLLRYICVIEYVNWEGVNGDVFGFGDYIVVVVFDCQVKF